MPLIHFTKFGGIYVNNYFFIDIQYVIAVCYSKSEKCRMVSNISFLNEYNSITIVLSTLLYQTKIK
ncbi:MAG: hypothetical protein CVT99_16195 [Bacteroidetes bacterium HGW-Bacteroidetes-16]|nr:MAG: hypothetical protein CVT99_16195 [Bacteroidetes bacterium HGW-Bacteroidetes-16]